MQQQQQWEPPSTPAQLSFGIKLNPKAESNTQQQQQPGMNSAFMEARRIVCDRPRVRGDKGPVVPTWFLLGSGWQVQQQGAARQQQQLQQKQPQKQQAKVQAGKKANPDAAGAPSKPAGGSKSGQVKPHYEAYSREQQQQQQHASNPAAAVPLPEGRRRRDRFAEEVREHQPQQGQLASQEDDRWPAAEDEAAWYAYLLGRPDGEEEEDASSAVWAAPQRRQPDVWRWSAAAELSWAEDEPDWPEFDVEAL